MISEQLYCTRPSVSYAFGRSDTMIADAASGALVPLPEPVAQTLDCTRSLKTLGLHAQSVRRRLGAPPDSEPRIAELLAELARDGLLVSLEELCAPTREAAAAPITSVCVLTRDRPSELERCLESIVESSRRHARGHEIVIFDDTREASAERRSLELLRTLGARHDVPFRYAGRAAKRDFARKLAEVAGVSQHVAQFCLTGCEGGFETIGANRNAILLDTIGRALLSVDDDMVFRGVLPPNARSGLRVIDGRDPTELWFCETRRELRETFSDVDLDVIGAHERVLGRTVGSLISSADSATIDDPTPTLAALLANGDARVTVSLSGVIGDSGHHSPLALLTHDAGQTRSRLLASADSYRSALGSREVLRTVDRVTLGISPALAAGVVGLDNSGFLPPFSPAHRNEDGVFGLLCRLCTPGAYRGWIPASLWHLADERRFAPAAALQAAAGIRLSELVMALCLECPLHSLETRPERRLNSIASYLSQIGALGPDEFADIARHAARSFASRRASLLDAELRARRGPEFWSDDVRAYLERTKDAAREPDFWLPLDVDATRVDRASYTRRYVRRFGALCAGWSKLRRAATELAMQGERLSQPVGLR